MISWYVAEPDGIGHHYGPHSPQADSAIRSLDDLLGYFMKKLAQHPLADQVNVIITADHGMGNISEDKSIQLSQYIKSEWVAHIHGSNPIYNIKAKENYKDSIFMALDTVGGISIYKNPDLPSYLNYGSHKRCLDFTVVADSSYSVFDMEPRRYSNGTHGYDIANKDMNAIFYAYGPAFKENYRQPSFKNISVYPLMCEILGLYPAPNDGNRDEVVGMLR